MNSPGSGEHLWIIGAGRMGLAMGSVLRSAGIAAKLTVSGRRRAPPDHPLFRPEDPSVLYRPDYTPPSPTPGGLLIAVPDAAIAEVASRVAAHGPPAIPVLHLSGSLGWDVLEPLAARGCPVGSLHPLASVATGAESANGLIGAWYGVEAEGTARAFAGRIVDAVSGRALPIQSGNKPLYHSAAVFASNYVVVLLDCAERLMQRAGISGMEAREALTALAGGAVRNVATTGPTEALTGPVARGDADTLRLHLDRLSGDERDLYCVLARQALRLAREAGLDAKLVRNIDHLLGSEA